MVSTVTYSVEASKDASTPCMNTNAGLYPTSDPPGTYPSKNNSEAVKSYLPAFPK